MDKQRRPPSSDNVKSSFHQMSSECDFPSFRRSDFRFASTCLLLFCPLQYTKKTLPAQLIAASRLSPPSFLAFTTVSIFPATRLPSGRPSRRSSKTCLGSLPRRPQVSPENHAAVSGFTLMMCRQASSPREPAKLPMFSHF